MNYFTKNTLLSFKEDIGNLIELNFNDESSAVVSEYGGRLLGLYPKNDCYSLLWINPEIKEVVKTRRRDIGGDRYWISPEREFFYEKPTSCTLSTMVTVESQIKKHIYNGEITRQISLIKEPISTGLSYCGVEFVDDCAFFQPNLKINGWSLACIISGGPSNPGTVLIPTKPSPRPLSYFRYIPEDRLKVGNNYVAFKLDVDDVYKLAVRPEDIDFTRHAKIGYVVKIPDSEEYGFLVKLSNDIPKTQDDCFDVSRDHPESEIGVIQSYNSESPNKLSLKYGEIELQLSKFETIDNASHGKARHQIIGYIGSKEEVLEVVEKYLGIANLSLF
jgi:hypothetical protein